MQRKRKRDHSRYDFSNNIDGTIYHHYIEAEEQLTPGELKKIEQLLAFFPHASNKDWAEIFATLDTIDFPKKLIKLAANAYDYLGNTMLGVAAENGRDIPAIQRLIDMNAELNTPDKNNKLALHWAICNRPSFHDRSSFDAAKAVKCLLDNKARIDITCYQNCTPLDYAKKRDYTAAARLIEDFNFRKRKVALASGLHSRAGFRSIFAAPVLTKTLLEPQVLRLIFKLGR